MQVSESAELFAKERFGGALRADGTTHLGHLGGVVSRLKGLGVSDQEVLASAWLHSIINETPTTFDEIDKRFGSRVAVLVLSLTPDKSLPRSETERQYVKQLRESPIEAKLIKLCDTSTTLKDLKGAAFSRTKKAKQLKKELYYISVMKHELSLAKAQHPGIQAIINGINEIASSHGQRPVMV
ncbi:MAG TPA: HD domain-containing protein [Candidatus Nitrosotalea sp.]|nr:HD domain-containing protein [Candidatus Nitrosotalea sp.]